MYLAFFLHATDVHTCCGRLASLSIDLVLVFYLCIGYVYITVDEE